MTAPHLARVTVASSNIAFSEPAGRWSSADRGYSIECPDAQSPPANITYYLTQRKNPYLSFIIPLILGFPLGLIGAVQLISTRIWAKRASVGAGIALAAVILVLIVYFPIIQGYANTDILLAAGSIIGLLLASVYVMRKQRPGSIPAASP